MVPPFRPETGMSPTKIPVYSTETPSVPPYLPYRKVSVYPRYLSYKQLKNAYLPQNLAFYRRDEFGLGNVKGRY
ncbi:hypothetical protein [Tenuibacillus multivorans]|uniref:hypothetical protein n=1 Tax=Tenuibacillus multivorans TaxID=237069 RepID=UPI000B880FD5|nr:hypothetical protein [Tenuibacillus multivorans]